MNNGDNSLLTAFQMNSIGFKSGEYIERNTRFILSFRGFLWLTGHDEI